MNFLKIFCHSFVVVRLLKCQCSKGKKFVTGNDFFEKKVYNGLCKCTELHENIMYPCREKQQLKGEIMMNRKLKTSIAVILITLAAESTAKILTGCGEDKRDTKSTTPATTAATKATQAATAAAQAQENGQTQTQAITNAPAQNNDSQASSNNIGISEADAIANVKQQAGSGAQIISSYPGTSPDGLPAWVITVAPVSNSADTPNVVYYSGYQFCYPAQ